jgi:hypothetical protein
VVQIHSPRPTTSRKKARKTGPFCCTSTLRHPTAAHNYAACRHLLAADGVYVTTLPNAGLMIGKLLTLFSSRRCAMLSVKPVREDLELVASFLSEGMLIPIDATFPVRALSLAFARLQEGEMRGRVSIQVEGGLGS